MIDKLTLRLERPISIALILNRVKDSMQNAKKTKLCDQRWHLQIGDGELGTYCKIKDFALPQTQTVATNPSSFSNFSEYLNHLSIFLTQADLKDAKVQRMDFAIDYAEPLQSFWTRVDVRFKQLVSVHTSKCGKLTGLTIGKGTERIEIYDKAFQLKQAGRNLTRLEVQLSGKKIPCARLSDVSEKILGAQNEDRPAPFKNIFTGLIEITPIGENANNSAIIKHTRLKTLLECMGYFTTRKILNTQGNFMRDYGEIFSIIPDPIQPNALLTQSLTSYFSPNKHDSTKQYALEAQQGQTL